MSTVITSPAPVAPDDAFSSFKAAEGTLTLASGQQTSAHAALASAQTASDAADAAVETASTAASAATDNLIASLQTYKAGLPSGTPSGSGSGS